MESGSSNLKIFVVEDDEWYQKLLVHTLSLNPDHEVIAFDNAKDCLDKLHQKPDLVTIDYRLPDMNGEELLESILRVSPETAVIAVSEQENVDTAVSMLKKGAYDYLTKTKDIRDRLLHLIANFSKNADLRSTISNLQKEVEQKYDFQNSMIGQSNRIKEVFKLMQKATSTNITVMVNGETGTGKEVVAKSIHYNSIVKEGPFVAVNMSAIPKELAESELFGHEKGSFTGAGQRHKGKFEQAKGGTLFLDEIGEMDINLQAKLLRALQEREITRVGGSETIKTDCRIIAATHRNLLDEMKKGNFREDLYYRLFGLPINLPALRDRDKDVILLAKNFVKSFCEDNGMTVKTLDNAALQKLMAYSFPGNIRELKSIMELAVVMSDNDSIGPDDITFAQTDTVTDIYSENMTMRDYELKIVQVYLKKFDNDIKAVAKKLDIGQSTIYRMLKEVK
ncbi:sigma-54 dependent transcriptional regulator [Marinoscillum sp. MHG1-6]|uniref:sigma-54-dependent transcriptional regulator n=1 Tax=Marinoscillum sp. MHG1-6 TaxID=2959627 RepID=UPI002158176C|nr:sigma-54 dependent transcriptional regulator [Marinoscillum sp. MHG1-6]